MTSINDVETALFSIPFESDEADYFESVKVVDLIRKLPNPRDSVTLILRWFEQNSEYDLGSPGPLVHFLEEKIDYIPALISSLERKPNDMSIWLVNRLCNAETDKNSVERWISVLQAAKNHPLADTECQSSASEFIKHQEHRLEA